jgi:hypothetical protein
MEPRSLSLSRRRSWTDKAGDECTPGVDNRRQPQRLGETPPDLSHPLPHRHRANSEPRRENNLVQPSSPASFCYWFYPLAASFSRQAAASPASGPVQSGQGGRNFPSLQSNLIRMGRPNAGRQGMVQRDPTYRDRRFCFRDLTPSGYESPEFILLDGRNLYRSIGESSRSPCEAMG